MDTTTSCLFSCASAPLNTARTLSDSTSSTGDSSKRMCKRWVNSQLLQGDDSELPSANAFLRAAMLKPSGCSSTSAATGLIWKMGKTTGRRYSPSGWASCRRGVMSSSMTIIPTAPRMSASTAKSGEALLASQATIQPRRSRSANSSGLYDDLANVSKTMGALASPAPPCPRMSTPKSTR